MKHYPFDPVTLDAMPEELANLFRNLELTLLKNIADRLKSSGELNESAIQNIRALRSIGISFDEIENAIRETVGISQEKLKLLLDDAVKLNTEYYTELIDIAALTAPETIVDDLTIDAIRRQTLYTFKNITQSMGFLVDSGRTMLPPTKAYQWALDNATIQIQSGAISYNQAISNATRHLADSGLTVVDYESGRHDHVDVAVRRAVMTAVSQISDKYTEQGAEYLGTRYYEISAHAGARDVDGPNGWENHKKWQGKVYYESEHGEPDPLGKYPDLVNSTGFGYVDGLSGANCRHRRYPWLEGVSERTYTDAQLENIDKPPFKYEGKTYTTYEATQKQRQIENAIRHWKRRQAAATNEKDEQKAKIRIRILNQKYKEFSNVSGLRMQKERANAYVTK